MELGQPLPVWHSVVAYGETQVLNSNSTSAVQDPLYELERNSYLWHKLQLTMSDKIMISISKVAIIHV